MWNVFIDVFGTPYESIYVGMFLINDGYSKQFLTEFYGIFPQLKHYNKKANKVRRDDLRKVIDFFNSKKLRMVCYHFGNHQWKVHKRRINELMKEVNDNHKYVDNIGGYKEKIMGMLYYSCIRYILPNREKCIIKTCVESSIDIMQVIDAVKKLSKRDKLDWEIYPVMRKHDELLKMADYVAGANRKLDEFSLTNIPRHYILKNPLRDFDLRKIFRIFSK